LDYGKLPGMAQARNDTEHWLYDPTSKRFLTANWEWTPDKQQASTFSNLARSIQFCLRHGIKDAEVLIQLNNRRKVRVPICA
jgi:hypothetical protein